jgi:hypothetical protein
MRTSEPNQFLDCGEFISQIAGKYRLVMGNPVSQASDFEQILIDFCSGLLDCPSGVQVGHDRSEVIHPKMTVEPGGEHFFPENKIHLGNQFAGCCRGGRHG